MKFNDPGHDKKTDKLVSQILNSLEITLSLSESEYLFLYRGLYNLAKWGAINRYISTKSNKETVEGLIKFIIFYKAACADLDADPPEELIDDK